MLNFTRKLYFFKMKAPGRVTNKNDKPSVSKKRAPSRVTNTNDKALIFKKQVLTVRKRSYKSSKCTVSKKTDCGTPTHPPPKNAFFNCSKESGLNSDSKFLVGRKEATRVSGFILIRLRAELQKMFSRNC